MLLRLLPLGLLLASAPAASPDAIATATQAALPQLMDFYRDFHAHPELSLHETATAAKLAAEARRLGMTVTEHVGGTGVVAVMKNGPGPVLLIRTDMDALPVTEATGLSFASTVTAKTADGQDTGVMHACGHDTHMATWVGTMRNLVAMKAQWSGTLVMIAQPAEEVGKGARDMLADGLFTRFPKPTVAIAFHDSASLPAGTIGVHSGYTFANVDSVDIDVRGVGGHGAYPATTKDPIVLAARIVGTLQTLVSRELAADEQGVVTVGSFHAGSKHNIIPGDAHLQLTVRSYTDAVRKKLLDGIARIARGEAIAAGVPDDRMPIVTVQDEFTPALFNTEPMTAHLQQLFTARFGADRVVWAPATMGGEDFSRYWLTDKSTQSMIFWVGGVPREKWAAAQAGKLSLPSLHSAGWAPDAEAVIATATEAMTAAALDILKRPAA